MYKVVVEVEGMACPHCEAHVNEAVRAHFDVKKVTSSHTKRKTVILCAQLPDQAALTAAITDAGYTVTGVSVEEKKGLFSFSK